MVTPEQLKFIVRGFSKKRPMRVSLDHIDPHPNYPKTRLKDLKEIEDSIRSEGFSDRYPLKVIPHPTKRGHYQLIDGHRRLEATKRCLKDPNCAEHIKGDVPILVNDYSKDDLDSLYDEDQWKRYPIPEQKAKFKNPLYCPQCGTKLMPDDNFCPECGFRVK